MNKVSLDTGVVRARGLECLSVPWSDISEGFDRYHRSNDLGISEYRYISNCPIFGKYGLSFLIY